MKIKALLVCLAIFVSVGVFAQKRGSFEVGTGFAPRSWILVAEGVPNMKCQFSAYAEYRYSLGRFFDAGVQLNYKTGPSTKEKLTHYIGLFGVADFNMFNGKAVSPFIGIGIGPALGISHNDYVGGYAPSFILTFLPRVGVELFEHLRLSAEVDVTSGPVVFNPICFSIGWKF